MSGSLLNAKLLASLNTCLFSLSSVMLLSLSLNLIQWTLVIAAMGSQPMSPIRATIVAFLPTPRKRLIKLYSCEVVVARHNVLEDLNTDGKKQNLTW